MERHRVPSGKSAKASLKVDAPDCAARMLVKVLSVAMAKAVLEGVMV